MRALRSLIAFVIPSLLGILLLLLLLLPLGRRRAVNITLFLISRLGLWLAGIRIELQGDLAALHRRPAVFVVNHQSGTDPLIIARVMQRDVVGIAKASLRAHPLLGPLLRLVGTTFVEPDQGSGTRSLAPALARLQENYGVTIAAEGHRSRDGRLLPFRPGVLWLARTARVAIVPVVLHNSREILPKGAMVIRPGTVRITVLSPLDPDTLTLRQLEALFLETLAGMPVVPARPAVSG